MIEALRKLFKRDREVELKLLEIIKAQQEFIALNIKERVVYTEKESGYTNADRFETREPEEDNHVEEEFAHDMTPQDLEEHFNRKKEGKDKVDENENTRPAD